MRLAVFVDQIFWSDGDALSTDESFILFPASFTASRAEVVFIGRKSPEPGRAPYALDGCGLVALPYYEQLYSLWRQDPRVFFQIWTLVRKHAEEWDAIIISGPHPIGQLIARICISCNVPVFLLLRQNLTEMMSAHRGLKRMAAVAAARILEWDFKRLARGRTAFTVGERLAAEYKQHAKRVYAHFPCLVDQAQFEDLSAAGRNPSARRLLCVGRLSPEKGYAFLFEALSSLKKKGFECHVDMVGDGALRQELEAKVDALGLRAHVTFHGYVPYGPRLFDFYQKAEALVLPSLTEGFPQVINEALCSSLPIIASNVGGIPSFLTDNETALLVPPADTEALARAIERIITDEPLRDRLSERGRALMAENTLEANRALIMGVIRDELRVSSA